MNAPRQLDLGFVGLGQIGGVMAARLIGAGVRLHVYDPRAEAAQALVDAGAIAAASPKAVADAATIVFASLPNNEVSEQVAAEVAAGARLRHYVEMSTIGRQCMETIASTLGARRIGSVDAPVTGGVPGALRGTLSIMVSGAPADRDAVMPWLGKIGGKLTVLGDEPGQAQVMKLVCNLVVAANMVAASEGLAMGAKAGLDPEKMLALLNSGTARSAATSDILPDAVLTRTFAFGARTSIIDKDVRLGLSQAEHLGVPSPVIAAAADIWQAAGARDDLRDDDFTAIIRLVEQAAGTHIGNRQAGN
ncbi:NAD(P)-dependent oxidoreductase [Ramlibacter sp.]|uniref:NAD(P)-dependent oxidoreductase n=1 Tax=Ramlibacter sp. TaxID=1917967 RepID=UPI003D10FD1B